MFRRTVGWWVGWLGAASLAAAAPPAPADAEAGQPVLASHSFWRVHVTLRPPLVGSAADARPDHRYAAEWISKGGGIEARWPKTILPPDQPASPLPPADWMKPQFDDRDWWRDPGPFYGHPPQNWKGHARYGYQAPQAMALLCLRGKFGVADPAAVGDGGLTLSAEFRGGLVVYLNGVEVLRHGLPAGPIGPLTLADDVPVEACVKNGTAIPFNDYDPKQLEKRIRSVQAVPLPARLLRKGANVLALELHRTAFPAELAAAGNSTVRYTRWSPVGLCSVELTAAEAAAAAVVPSVARPKGLQVWTRNVAQVVTQSDYGDPFEPLAPLRIVAARNGTFNGQVLVGCDVQAKGVRGTLSPLTLRGGSAVLPADAAAVRYPEPCDRRWARPRFPDDRSGQFDAIADQPPPEMAANVDPGHAHGGCVQPVWVTARVPADAAPGTYDGALTISADGQLPVAVPVELTVCDWKLPAPADGRTILDLIQSPESVALYCKTPLWSPQHFDRLAASLKLLAEVGNKTLYVPAIARTNFGNAESMVRWVRGADGGYAPDLGPVEKYLDLAAKCGVRPSVVCLQVWDYHVGYDEASRWGRGGYPGGPAPTDSAEAPVTVFDPATGEASELKVAPYGSPEAERFWTPLIEPLRRCLAARGLDDKLMIGLCGDYGPKADAVAFWKKLLPEAKWVTMGHWPPPSKGVHGVPVGYATMVTFADFGVDPAIERLRGWGRPEYWAYFTRLPVGPLPAERLWCEWAVNGNLRGLGRQAADFWHIPAQLNGRTRAYTLSARYPNSSWRNLNLRPSYLAPGPEGARSTVRFELLREGRQEAEARVFIDSILADPAARARLGEALAVRCQDVLDERARCKGWANEFSFCIRTFLPGGPLGFDWYAGSGWPQRDEKLYSAAGEAAQRLEQFDQ